METEVPETKIQEKVKRLKFLVTSRDTDNLKSYLDENENELHEIFKASVSEGENIVSMTCTLGLTGVIDLFDKKSVLYNIQDEEGYYPIHRAAYNHHVSLVRHLIKCFGASTLLDATRNGLNALHISASIGDLACCELLTPLMPDINVQGEHGWSALHIATQGAHQKIVNVLLEHGADIDMHNVDGDTPLILATQNDNQTLVEELLKRGAKVNEQNNFGVFALYLAVQNHSVPVIKLLLEYGANCNLQDAFGWCALHKASFHTDMQITYMLLKHGADPNLQNSNGLTCLDVCVSHSEQENATVCSKLLLMHGADCNVRDLNGMTAFLRAIMHDNVNQISMMIQIGHADVNRSDSHQSTPLYIACCRDNLEVVNTLIRAAASVNKSGPEGKTALHKSCARSNVSLTQALLAAGADPGISDVKGLTPLFIAAKLKNHKILKTIKDHGVSVNTIYQVAKKGDSSVLQYLESCEYPLLVMDQQGANALHVAAKEGISRAIKALLACMSVHHERSAVDKHGCTALHYACAESQVKATRALVNVSPDLHIQNKKGETCLHLAAKSGSPAIVDMLLQRMADVHVRDQNAETAVFKAVIGGHFEVVQILVRYGANLGTINKNGLRLVHLAARGGHKQVLFYLLANGQSPETGTLKWNTCLHLAAQKGHLDIIVDLIVKGANVNAENALGKKALHLAAYHGHLAVVEALLNAGTTLRLYGDDFLPTYDLARHVAVWECISGRPQPRLTRSRSPRRRTQCISQSMDQGDDEFSTQDLMLENEYLRPRSRDRMMPGSRDVTRDQLLRGSANNWLDISGARGRPHSTSGCSTLPKSFNTPRNRLSDSGASFDRGGSRSQVSYENDDSSTARENTSPLAPPLYSSLSELNQSDNTSNSSYPLPSAPVEPSGPAEYASNVAVVDENIASPNTQLDEGGMINSNTLQEIEAFSTETPCD